MPTLLSTCETCVELQFSPCCDIEITAPQLESFTNYWWKVTDQFGNVWQQQAITDLDGVLTIAKSFFPDGMFTNGIGMLSIVITENQDDTEELTLTYGYTDYTCISATFSGAYGQSECETEESEESSEPIVVLPDDALIFLNDDDEMLVETTSSIAIIDLEIPLLTIGSRITATAALGFQNIHGTMRLNQDDLDAMNTFATAVGMNLDIFFSARAYNTTTDVDAFLAAVPSAEKLQIDGEISNVMDAEDYKTICEEIIDRLDGSGVDPVVWLELAYKTNTHTLNYAAITRTIQGAADGTQYFHAGDLCDFGDDMDENLSQLETYFSATPNTNQNQFNLQGQWNTFISRYTNVDKMFVSQWHIEDSSDDPKVSNTPLSNWAITRFMKFVFEHTDKISYLCHMSWGNLFRGQTTINLDYYSLKRVAPLFDFLNTFTVEFAITGVEGVGFNDGAGNYCLCITNKSGTSHVITADQIGMATGLTVTSNFTRDTGWAASWDDDTLNEVVTESNLNLREHSGSVITFTAA